MTHRHSKNFGVIQEENPSTINPRKFMWLIKDYENLPPGIPGEYEESPFFFTGIKNQYRWSIEIALNGCDSRQSLAYVGVSINLLNLEPVIETTDNFSTRLSIIDNKGEYIVTKQLRPNGDFYKFFVQRCFLSLSPLLLLNGTLRIVCEIFDWSYDKSMENFRAIQLDGIKKLFGDERFSDFKVIVKGNEFFVHRAILATHSPVFEAMFDSQMCESKEGEVNVIDVDSEVVEKMLRFMYSGDIKIEDLDDRMLAVAEMYQIKSLKLRCENEMIDKLSVENVYDMLHLSDRNNALKLKDKAIEFFSKELKSLFKASNFKESLDSLPGNLKTDMIYLVAKNQFEFEPTTPNPRRNLSVNEYYVL